MIKENIQAKEKPVMSLSVEYLDQGGLDEGGRRCQRQDVLISEGREPLNSKS
jgi:hypothetical protein